MARGATAGFEHILDWIADQALATTTAAEVLDGLVMRLRAEGAPIRRVHLTHTTLHPLFAGAGVTWTEEEGLVEESYKHGQSATVGGWSQSPIRHTIVNGIERLRRRLAGPGAMLDFPVLERFAEQGLTDYLLMTIAFDSFFSPADRDEDLSGAISGMAISFATSRDGGFTEDEIRLMHGLLRPLAVAVKMADQRQVAVNLAECYIGREAGPRVLGGAIKRGDFASTEAVVFLADLRGSTELSIALSPADFIGAINDFFDCAVTAVEAAGGEPLTFIGDGVLAIFPVDALGREGARAAAHKAAEAADAALAALNARREEADAPTLGWGVALHAGDLEYGNIGSLGRHSWSVVGAVVNETARLEALTKETGETIVASGAFVAGAGDGWRALGAFNLKGVPEPFEAFAPPTAPPVVSAKTMKEAI